MLGQSGLGKAKSITELSVSGRKELLTSYYWKGGEFMRLFVDKKEIPILINALVDYLGKHPSERYTVERLLNKINNCSKLQVTDNRKVK